MFTINFLPWREQRRYRVWIKGLFYICGLISILLLVFILLNRELNIKLKIHQKQNKSLQRYYQSLIKHRKQTPIIEKTIRPTLPTKLFHLNYTKAERIAKLIQTKHQNLLTSEGKIIVDNRTNSLFLQDKKQSLLAIQQLIKQFDIPMPQVLIQAHIVNMDSNDEKDLGVRWGITGGRHLSGTLAGANQMAGGASPASVLPEDRLNVDLPSTAEKAGHLGLALFKLAPGTLLDLELSALESEGRAEIISDPKLLTANEQSAMIASGQEIPYQESAGEGATTTAFKKVVLSLKVTPQITANHDVLLQLKVNQDSLSDKEVKGVPAIDTRQIQTQVLVGDGQTVVLGGIYEYTEQHNMERVPFFASLPIIGVLFRHHKDVNNRRELLIFVTPKIVTRPREQKKKQKEHFSGGPDGGG